MSENSENNEPDQKDLEKSEVIRDANGRVMAGSVLNPKGRPPGPMTRQSFAERASYLMTKYSVGELSELYKDKQALENLPFNDAAILTRMVNAINRDGGADFDRLYDRVIGKPLQQTEMAVSNAPPTPAEIAGVPNEQAALFYEQTLKE